MNVTAVVEKVDEEHYRAVIAQPFSMESTGASVNDAVNKLRDAALARLQSSQLVQFELPEVPKTNPLLRFAGIWKDRTDLDEYRMSIEEHRKEMDALEFP